MRSNNIAASAPANNLYPETTIKHGPGSSQTFQSRSTLHSLKGVESVAGRGTLISRQMSSNREFSNGGSDSRMSNNNIPNDQRILSPANPESQVDLKSFTLKSIDNSDYGFLDNGRFQHSPKVNKANLRYIFKNHVPGVILGLEN